MLTFLKIKNIALIDDLTIEFAGGLNLLTGETGSGKSIVVDSLGALTGERVSSDLIKSGSDGGVIEGSFDIPADEVLCAVLDEAGIGIEDSELIVRREISATGKNRIFINDRNVTLSFLKRVGEHLVDIHGQGDQTSLFDVETHIEMLDAFARNEDLKEEVAAKFGEWAAVRSELDALLTDETEKLQLLDLLRFQVAEIETAGLGIGEDIELEEEKRRLNNVEKLTALSGDCYALLYENEESTAASLEKAQRKINELAEFDTRFIEYAEGIASARAVVEDLAIAARDFRAKLEFSPERLEQIEDRLAELARLKRKYGGSIESVLEHLQTTAQRLENIEMAEFREAELRKRVAETRLDYVRLARDLHNQRDAAARKFEKQVIQNLGAVALDKARLEVRLEASGDDGGFRSNGFDSVEFYFSANPGEPPKPLAKVASGGEASRLMLILKTTERARGIKKTAVFDEIDIGIGGRVAESVGRKLKDLAADQQVLCVTHQPQIASLADRHVIIEKSISRGKTLITARELSPYQQVEEIARMLAGEQITDAARENARSMLAGR